MTEEVDFENLSYDEAMIQVIDSLSDATKPQIASLVIELFNEGLEYVNSEDSNKRLIAHLSFACVGGFLLSHVNANEPTPIMLAGSMIGEVEKFMKRVSEEIENRETEDEE